MQLHQLLQQSQVQSAAESSSSSFTADAGGARCAHYILQKWFSPSLVSACGEKFYIATGSGVAKELLLPQGDAPGGKYESVGILPSTFLLRMYPDSDLVCSPSVTHDRRLAMVYIGDSQNRSHYKIDRRVR